MPPKFGLDDTADVMLYNTETGEVLGFLDTIKATVEPTEIEMMKESFHRLLYSEPVEISLSNIFIDGISLSKLYYLDNEPKIRQLTRIYNKTKSKRIKRKVNMRILNEIDKHLL